MVRDLAKVGFGKGPSRARDAKQVMPRMHAIHHSIKPEEVNSNRSSGLPVSGWLHGTLGLDVPQDAISIGVPGYVDPQDVTLPKIVVPPMRNGGKPKAPSKGEPGSPGSGKIFCRK